MRKEIDLSELTLKKLQKLADQDGRKLKPYLERVLILHANEVDANTKKNDKRKGTTP